MKNNDKPEKSKLEEVEIAFLQVDEIMEYGKVMSGLQTLMDTQEIVSGLAPGFPNTVDEVDNDTIATTAFALIGEVFELTQEVGWKRWKDNKELTDEHKTIIAEEFADVLAFLGYFTYLISKRTGLTIKNLEDAYWNKTRKNIRRFYGLSGEEGYSGQSLDSDCC